MTEFPSTAAAGKRQPPARGRACLFPILLILAAGLCVYLTNLRTPFIFDDISSIVENTHLRTLWPPLIPMIAPPGGTLAGRPLVALTFAVNYAIGGLDPLGYHLVNLGIHFLNALLVWSLLRRALTSSRFSESFARAGGALATAVALIWTVHPLQTEAVVYVVQRTELLVTFFYLLTAWLAARSWSARRAWPWTAAAVAACALGMASKEVMISAPLFVLIYDATFVSDSYRDAWRRHRGLYIGLACTWIILAALMAQSPRGDTAGVGLKVSMLDSLRTQAWAIVHYLGLLFWPHHLAILEDIDPIRSTAAAAPFGLVVLALLGATLVGLWRRAPWGAAGALFFLVLAPSSSFVPITTELVAERRMYLPSAAVIGVVVVGAWAFLARGRRGGRGRPLIAVGVVVVAGIVVGLGVRSVVRIRDYRTDLGIWQANLALYPRSPRTLDTIGADYSRAGKILQAIPYYERAVQVRPTDFATPRYNLGNSYLALGRFQEAIPWYESALRIKPGLDHVRYNLANALVQVGRTADAETQLNELLQHDGQNPDYHSELGIALQQDGNLAEAVEEFTSAARLAPQDADAQANLAAALLQTGQITQALPHLNEAVRLAPRHPNATLLLGRLLLSNGQIDEAIVQLRVASEVRADDPLPLEMLAEAYAQARRPAEAVSAAQEAIRRANAAGAFAEADAITRRIPTYRASATQQGPIPRE